MFEKSAADVGRSRLRPSQWALPALKGSALLPVLGHGLYSSRSLQGGWTYQGAGPGMKAPQFPEDRKFFPGLSGGSGFTVLRIILMPSPGLW